MTRVSRAIEAIAAAVVAVSVSAAAGHAAEKIKVTMAATSMNYAPYYAAIERGYFKEEGFEVEIIKAGGGTATPALMSGSVDFSTSGASALSAILRGAKLRLVFFPWDRPTYQLWSTTPEITSLDQLKGKAIGIQTRGDTFEIATRLILIARGMDPNSVSYTPLGYGSGRMAAITAGSLPAVVLSRVDIEDLRSRGGLANGRMIVNMYGEVRMPYTGIAVSAKAIEKDRDRVKRLVRASIKGLAYSAAYKDKMIEYVSKYNPKAPRRALELDYDEVLASKTDDGTVEAKFQRQEADLRAEVISLAKDKIPPLDRIFDFSMADEVNRELAAAGWKPVE